MRRYAAYTLVVLTITLAGSNVFGAARAGKANGEAMDSVTTIVLQNDYVKYAIGHDARNLHFIDRATGVDYCDHQGRAERPRPVFEFLDIPGKDDGNPRPGRYCAHIEKSGKTFNASRASFSDGRLTLAFGESGVRAVIGLQSEKRYIVFTVLSISDKQLDKLTFLDIPLKLNGKTRESFAGCALALNLNTNVPEIPGAMDRLTARCYRRFGFEGAKVALIGCPMSRLRDVMKEVVSASPDLPHSPLGGPWALDAEINRGSYLIDSKGNLSEETVDDWVRLAKNMGMTQIDFHPGHSLRFGDYAPNPDVYPRGLEGVKAVVDKLHANGIAAGLHTYAFYLAKDTPWVTPIPDPRLAKDATFTLAAPLSEDSTDVPVVETTKDMSTTTGFFVANSVTIQIDDELITYSGLMKDREYAFTGCKRGACGTKVSTHAKGTKVYHLVEIYGLFLPDKDSSLFTEVAEKTAEVYNKCGFDMIYLDALGIPRLLGNSDYYWHYEAEFVFELWRHLKKPALIEPNAFHHLLWYTRSRMQAWDAAPRAGKRVLDMHCIVNDHLKTAFLPPNLGWWAIFAWDPMQPERTFPDEIEYLCGKCLAYDCCLSFVEGFSPEIWGRSYNARRLGSIVRQYEDLRNAHYFPESIRAKLMVPEDEFVLERADGKWRFRPVKYDKHKVQGLDGWSDSWRVSNEFESQPAQLRIEALVSAEPYDAQGNDAVVDFADASSFSTPSSNTGVSGTLRPAAFPVKGASISGCFSAESSHAKPGSAWTMVRKDFSPALDLTYKGLGVWIYGDGQGEILNFQLRNPKAVSDAISDRYVPVDFTGWRYFELIEPEGERMADYDWPYSLVKSEWKSKSRLLMSAAYPDFIFWTFYDKVDSLSLWYNNIPRGKNVECYISPIKALRQRRVKVKNPAISIGDRKITFPIELDSGAYIEFRSPSDCKAYDAQGELIGDVKPVGEAPEFRSGENRVEFTCDGPTDVNPRVNVTVISRGEPLK